MSWNRIGTPRAYVDLISYNLANGWSASSNITALQDDGSTPVTYDSGSTIEMFDMKPSNHVVIEKENEAFYIQFDTEFATDTLGESSFLAILNHNFYTANVIITVDISDDVTFSDTLTSTAISFTTVIEESDYIYGVGLFTGIEIGDSITVSGSSNGSNNGTFTVVGSERSDDTLKISTGFTNESAGATITITNNSSNNISGTRVSIDGNYTDVINAKEDGAGVTIDPAQNGWSLITFPTVTTDNKYLRITFTPESGGTGHPDFADDVKIGSILYGEYFDWAHSPELGVVTTYDYDGTNLHNSIGGSTYATSTHLGQPDWAVTLPWTWYTVANASNYYFNKRAGRMSHSMKFKYLADTDVFAYNQTSSTPSHFFDDDDSLHAMFYQRILGQHLPFLFTIDGTSALTGDYGLFRLSDSTFKTTQVAHRIWDVDLKITETW